MGARLVQANAPLPANAPARGHRLGRLAAADFGDKARDMAGGPARTLRIEPALEAVAGVGMKLQLAPGGGDRYRIEHGHLDEHIARVVADPGALAAHDTRKTVHAVIVADDDHALVHVIGLLVQRCEFLAAACLADHKVFALDQLHVIDVKRASKIEHHIVCDVDKGAYRALADGPEAALHPLRARPVRNAAHGDARDQRTQMRVAAKIKLPRHRAFEGALVRFVVERL